MGCGGGGGSRGAVVLSSASHEAAFEALDLGAEEPSGDVEGSGGVLALVRAGPGGVQVVVTIGPAPDHPSHSAPSDDGCGGGPVSQSHAAQVSPGGGDSSRRVARARAAVLRSGAWWALRAELDGSADGSGNKAADLAADSAARAAAAATEGGAEGGLRVDLVVVAEDWGALGLMTGTMKKARARIAARYLARLEPGASAEVEASKPNSNSQ